MSTYAGIDNFASAGTLPDDTAPPTAANINPFLEFLADRTIWLKNRLNDFRLVVEGETTTTDGNVVEIGSTPVTFTATSFSGNPSALPLAAVAAVAGDVFEFELTGSIQSTGALSDFVLKAIANDGAVVDVPHARLSWTVPTSTSVNTTTTASGGGPLTTWNAAYGAPFLMATIANLLVGDQVDICVMGSCGGPNSGDWSIRLESKEGSGAIVVEPNSDVTFQPTVLTPVLLRSRHTMAANGSLAIYIDGDAAAGGIELYGATRVDATVYRSQIVATPFALVGRYVVTTTGTLTIGLDGELVLPAAGAHVDVYGAMICKWRLMRSNA